MTQDGTPRQSWPFQACFQMIRRQNAIQAWCGLWQNGTGTLNRPASAGPGRSGNCLINIYFNDYSQNGSDGETLAPCPQHMTWNLFPQDIRWKAVWGPKRLMATLALLVFSFSNTAFAGGQVENRGSGAHDRRAVTKARSGRPNSRARDYAKVDGELVRRRNANPLERSSVIVTLVPGATLPDQFKRFARRNGNLNIINGQVLDLPNNVIRQLESRSEIFQVHHNRPIKMANYRTAFTVGARAIQRGLGLTGAGVGVAVIDSGIATWHDDLTNRSSDR